MWKGFIVLVALIGCSKKSQSAQAGADEPSRSGEQAQSGEKEAMLELNKIGHEVKVYAINNNDELPKGTAGPTPATPCCKAPGGRCAVTQDWASSPVWSALEFEIDEPNRFQYSYESDGKTFTATAVGDPDCHGKPVTYKVEGTLDSGSVSLQFTDPTSGGD